MSLALRPYQLEAISAIESSQASRQLVVLPTGSSKTVVLRAHLPPAGPRSRPTARS